MAQCFRALAAHEEDVDFVLAPTSWRMTICNSSSMGSSTIFWPLWELHERNAQTCIQAYVCMHTYKIKKKKKVKSKQMWKFQNEKKLNSLSVWLTFSLFLTLKQDQSWHYDPSEGCEWGDGPETGTRAQVVFGKTPGLDIRRCCLHSLSLSSLHDSECDHCFNYSTSFNSHMNSNF